MDPKGRLSSQIHFLVPLGITYSDSLHCGNTLVDPKGCVSFLTKKRFHFRLNALYEVKNGLLVQTDWMV